METVLAAKPLSRATSRIVTDAFLKPCLFIFLVFLIVVGVSWPPDTPIVALIAE
jgi:hypothetical protein